MQARIACVSAYPGNQAGTTHGWPLHRSAGRRTMIDLASLLRRTGACRADPGCGGHGRVRVRVLSLMLLLLLLLSLVPWSRGA